MKSFDWKNGHAWLSLAYLTVGVCQVGHAETTLQSSEPKDIRISARGLWEAGDTFSQVFRVKVGTENPLVETLPPNISLGPTSIAPVIRYDVDLHHVTAKQTLDAFVAKYPDFSWRFDTNSGFVYIGPKTGALLGGKVRPLKIADRKLLQIFNSENLLGMKELGIQWLFTIRGPSGQWDSKLSLELNEISLADAISQVTAAAGRLRWDIFALPDEPRHYGLRLNRVNFNTTGTPAR